MLKAVDLIAFYNLNDMFILIKHKKKKKKKVELTLELNPNPQSGPSFKTGARFS